MCDNATMSFLSFAYVVVMIVVVSYAESATFNVDA